MATERNPFEQISDEVTNVIEITNQKDMDDVEEQSISFEPSEDGGVIVDFSSIFNAAGKTAIIFPRFLNINEKSSNSLSI